MIEWNSPILELTAQELASLWADLDRAELGAMILQLNDMVGDLRERLARRHYNTQVAIAAAELNQARQTLEKALQSLEEDTVGIEVSHEIFPNNAIRLRIEEVP